MVSAGYLLVCSVIGISQSKIHFSVNDYRIFKIIAEYLSSCLQIDLRSLFSFISVQMFKVSDWIVFLKNLLVWYMQSGRSIFEEEDKSMIYKHILAKMGVCNTILNFVYQNEFL